MEVNANFEERVVVHANQIPWTPSPIAGVERRMLDRMGDEVARATSIVRYAPGSQFSPHVHSGGEEFLVLEGVFQDEHGDFSTGTYVRNPPTTRHTPGSREGCVIFVKLWQFDSADRNQFRKDTNSENYEAVPGTIGITRLSLHKDDDEEVCVEQWPAGSKITLDAPNGLEALVLDGSFEEGGDFFAPQSWLRLPKGSLSMATSGPNGVRVWIKRHHLHTYPEPPNV